MMLCVGLLLRMMAGDMGLQSGNTVLVCVAGLKTTDVLISNFCPVVGHYHVSAGGRHSDLSLRVISPVRDGHLNIRSNLGVFSSLPSRQQLR
jgi:hypothetical protein